MQQVTSRYLNGQTHPRENLIHFLISSYKTAEQDRNYLPLPCGCAGSRERSSQGQMSLCKEKGPGNCPRLLAHSRFIPEQGLSSVPTQPILVRGGESPSVSCSLEAKTPQLLKGFEADKP